MFPFIFRIVGVEEFGKVMVANSFAWLLTVIVTWGSGQSGVNDIAISREHPLALSRHFKVIMQTRAMLIFSTIGYDAWLVWLTGRQCLLFFTGHAHCLGRSD